MNGVTLVKCATPSCMNGVRASREIYCPTCQRRQQAANPEAPETTRRQRWTGGD